MGRMISDLLFACDLDDTMLDSKKEISSENQRAIADFASKGGKFVIATGRAVPATEPYAKQMGVKHPCVLYNGAAIYDFSAGRFLWKAALVSEAREYLKEIMTVFPQVGAEILKDEQIYVVRKNQYISAQVDVERLDYCEVEADEVADGWFKILMVMDSDILDEVWNFIAKKQYASVDFVKSSCNYIEMLPRDISKGATVMRLAEMLGVKPENTVGMGDYNNDIEMLQLTAFSFSPENAPDEVKEQAKHITPSCNQNAVAYALDYITTQADFLK